MAKDHWTTLPFKVISITFSQKRVWPNHPKKTTETKLLWGFQVIAVPAFKCPGSLPFVREQKALRQKKKNTKMAALTKKKDEQNIDYIYCDKS